MLPHRARRAHRRVGPNGSSNSNTVWQYFTSEVTATGSLSQLAFSDASFVDTVGGYLDDVSLVALDLDGDGVTDDADDCPENPNSGQEGHPRRRSG